MSVQELGSAVEPAGAVEPGSAAEPAGAEPAGAVEPGSAAEPAGAEPAGAAAPPTTPPRWVAVCALADLVPERGAAALVDGAQVALVRLVDDTVLAVQNLDPFSGAHVLARGIVGTRGDAPSLASPMYKQVFDLRDGRCLDTLGYATADGGTPDLRTWPVEVREGVVLVAARPVAAP